MQYFKLAFQKFAQFTGRSNRPEYWYFVLYNIIFSIGVAILDTVLGFGILSVIYGLAVLVPGLSAAVRRLHDINKSGWYILLSLIPLIGTIWLLVLLATKGTEGENQYGPDPNGQPSFDFEANPSS